MSDAKPWDTLRNKPPAPPPPIGILARLRAWTRKHWLITTLLVLYGLSHVWDWVLTPTINPHPQDLVTIKGTFPFDQGYEMNVHMGAYTTTKWINQWHGFLIPGRPIAYYSKQLPLTITQVGPKNYEFSFYRDFYLPGIAGWHLSGLWLSIPKKDAPPPKTSFAFPRITMNMKCFEYSAVDKDLMCSALDKDGSDIYMPPNRNFEVNFIFNQLAKAGVMLLDLTSATGQVKAICCLTRRRPDATTAS
ncbi:UNVERIFIED_ORG: hypothetical protein HNP28_000995 [Comamonas terrigena]